jgi:ubiquinone biosynthesis monooxygenase Coq7
MAKQTKLVLPGDRNPKDSLAQILRVNHAGEYGARRIYEGQLRILKGTRHEAKIREMWEQEAAHLSYFEKAIPEHRVRPTALLPLWHVAGYALGAATAMMGSRVAMACTVAVEEVIDQHYAEQEEQDLDPKLKQKIAEFRADENHHRDIGLEEEAELAPGYDILTGVIKVGSRAAIWLSKRI